MVTKSYRNATATETIYAVNNLVTSNFKDGCPVCVLDINVDGEKKKESIIAFLVLDSKEYVKSVVAHTDGIRDDSPLIALFYEALVKNTELASRNGLVYKLSDIKVEKLITDAISGNFSEYWEDYGTLMTGYIAA